MPPYGLSMTEKWDKASIFSPKKRKVGKTHKQITKDDIIECRSKLKYLKDIIHCIFRCLVTYKKPFIEYFEEIDNNIIFRNVEWENFIKKEFNTV